MENVWIQKFHIRPYESLSCAHMENQMDNNTSFFIRNENWYQRKRIDYDMFGFAFGVTITSESCYTSFIVFIIVVVQRPIIKKIYMYIRNKGNIDVQRTATRGLNNSSLVNTKHYPYSQASYQCCYVFSFLYFIRPIVIVFFYYFISNLYCS